jgi:hypothetical protein
VALGVADGVAEGVALGVADGVVTAGSAIQLSASFTQNASSSGPMLLTSWCST